MGASRVVEIARSYVGTPFHHAGRVKGVGVDCSGLIVGVLSDLGKDVSDVPSAYERGDHYEAAIKWMRKFAVRVDTVKPGDEILAVQEGDILVFRSRLIHQHLAIVSGVVGAQITIIHAWDGVIRSCAEVPLDGRLARTPYSVWRLK